MADQSLPSAGPSTAPAGSSHYRPNAGFSFPAAFQPSIIRSFQKDSYYLSLLQNHLSDVTREIFGSRFLQINSQKLALLASIAYYVFTTAEGAQTLGEEYVGARMVGAGGRYVTRKRRTAFILTQILAPFLLSRVYAQIRRRVNASHAARSQTLQRAKMRWKAIHGSRYDKSETEEPQPSRFDRLVQILAGSMPSIEDLSQTDGWLAYGTAFHLMLFYLGGKYYKFAQRLVGVKYISIHPAPPGQTPPSYEVLGVLLGIQFGVKLALSLNRYLHKRALQKNAAPAEGSDAAEDQQVDDEATVEVDGRKWTHSSGSAKPVGVDLQEDAGLGETESLKDYSALLPPGARVPLVYPSSTGTLLPSHGSTARPTNDEISAAQLRTASVESASQSMLRCTLCMDERTPERGTSAVTECGHIFDWTCIMSWLREKGECPLCRQEVSANRVIPIYNL